MKVSAGYSLVELLVVITIIGLLLTLGVPSYRYVTNSNRISGEVNALLGDLQFARSEAIKEGGTVIVCPAKTDFSACAGSSTWNSGWIVTSVTTAKVLRVQAAFANTNDSFVSADGKTTEISFNRNGFASAVPAVANGSVTIKLTTVPNASQWQRCVEVLIGGAITTEKFNQGACTA